jgi:hypothetical protein
MARGRLISKSLSTSAKFAELQTAVPELAEFCQCLYMLLVAHSDDWGRQAGDVFTVKHVIAPASPRSMREVEVALTALHNAGMVVWYESEGRKLIQINDFDAHQPGLHKRAEKSKFPEAPVSVGKFPTPTGDSLLSEVKRTEVKGREVNRTGHALKRVARAESPDGFDAFWQSYPKGKKRLEAVKAWNKLAPDAELQEVILSALSWQRLQPDWMKENARFAPDASTYLNNRRWEDEPPKAAKFAGQLSDIGMQSLVGLSAFRERMAAKAAGGEQ